MTDNENVPVAAPEKWMNGWDKIYKSMLEYPDAELADISAPFMITQLMHAFAVTGTTDLSSIYVLELACGAGDGMCLLAKNGATIEGIEALASAVEVANRRIRFLNLEDKANVRLGNIDGWDIELGKYDAIIILQSLQYLFDRTIPRLREILSAIKPGGFFVYSGNILPHMETDPPIRFITEEELKTEMDGWTFHHFGTFEAIIKPGDIRGYVQLVARKPDD